MKEIAGYLLKFILLPFLLLCVAAVAKAETVGSCKQDEATLMEAAGANGIEAPGWVQVHQNWPISDLAFAYYDDATGMIYVNTEQVSKLPSVDACSVAVHEIRHHIQSHVAPQLDLQQREIDAYTAQQAYLDAHRDELSEAPDDGNGIFDVKRFKYMERVLSQDGVPTTLTFYDVPDCHRYDEYSDVTICVWSKP